MPLTPAARATIYLDLIRRELESAYYWLVTAKPTDPIVKKYAPEWGREHLADAAIYYQTLVDIRGPLAWDLRGR